MDDGETDKIIILHFFFNIWKAWRRETLRLCLFMIQARSVLLK